MGRAAHRSVAADGVTTTSATNQMAYRPGVGLGNSIIGGESWTFGGSTQTVTTHGMIQFNSGDGAPLSFNGNGDYCSRVSFTGGTPNLSRVGVTMAPEVSTAADEDPVIMPGSINSAVMPMVSRNGSTRKRRIIQAAADSIRPMCCTVFMKIIAQKMISMVSR